MQSLLNKIDLKLESAPVAEEFALWRAMLSMAHVDNDIADMEDYLVESITQVFKFSDEQKAKIVEDMQVRPNPKNLFKEIESQAYRAQFFRLARVMIWCDGILHEDELKIVDEIKGELGGDVHEYESDLRWMNRKPDLPMGESASSPEEEVVMHIIFQMIAFYEQQEG